MNFKLRTFSREDLTLLSFYNWSSTMICDHFVSEDSCQQLAHGPTSDVIDGASSPPPMFSPTASPTTSEPGSTVGAALHEVPSDDEVGKLNVHQRI